MSEYLDRLAKIESNPEQFKALRTNASCAVIAGPGSGKTYLLTAKITKLLLEQIQPPRGIACITYSRLLARQLQAEFRKIGIGHTPRLFVGTVHSFCLSEIIQLYKHLCNLRLPEPFRIASRKECKVALRQALLEQKINKNDDYYVDQVLKDLNKYRRRNPYYDSVLEQGIEWSDLANRYTSLLLDKQEPAVDFVHLEVLALRTIEKHDVVRRALEAKYPFLAIDEYQDLNYPFHRMVSHLLENTGMNVFAIGDKDQCIYEQLQGTNPKYIDELANQIKARDGNESITLLRNYRSADELIRISEIVIGGTRDYQSDTENGLFVSVNCQGGLRTQFQVLLKDLLPKILHNPDIPDLSKVAILHPRRKNVLGVISDKLEDLPHSLDKEPDYDNSYDLTEWIEQLAQWCVLGMPDFDELAQFWIELNMDINSRRLNSSRFELEIHLFQLLQHLRNSDISLRTWLEDLMQGLNFENLLPEYKKVRPDDVDEFDRLVAATHPQGRMADWTLTRFAKTPNKIQVTTLHSSKGMEFEIVIIMGAEYINKNDRRLAYVGVTRARKKVYWLYSGQSPFVDEIKARSPKPKGFHNLTRSLR